MGKTKKTKEEVIEALRKTKGAIYLAARRLGISADSVTRYMRRWREVAAVVAEERGRMIDFAENRLYGAILRKEAWAIAFCLKTIGKDRGYFEKIDTAHWAEEARRLATLLAAPGPADAGQAAAGGGAGPADGLPGGPDPSADADGASPPDPV